MSVLKNKLDDLLDKVQWEGGWAEFASYCGGEADTGDEELDNLVQELYNINEKLHRRANTLCVQNDLPLLGDRDV